MAYTIPTTEPARFRAGDSLIFKRAFNQFSAVDWTLSYHLRGKKKIDFTATAEGTGFSISVPAATTAGWLPGDYYWQAVVTSGTEKHTVGTGKITVLQNLAAVTDENFDGRTDTRKAFDAIEAVLKKTASRQQEEYQIDGVQVKDKPIAELLVLRDHYKSLIDQEASAEHIESGRPGKKKILFRFVK